MYYVIFEKRKRGWTNRGVLKILLLGIAALLVFFGLFTVIGNVTKQMQAQGVLDRIAFYTGLSIPSLDEYLRQIPDVSYILGKESLYGIQSILRKFGFAIQETTRHLEFSDFNGVSGNVYTSLRRYINDYGVMGMLLIQTYLGIFYNWIYYQIRRTKHFNVMLIFLGFMAYPLVMQGIDDLFLSSYISTSTIYLWIYLGVFYYIVIGRNSKQERLEGYSE